MEDFAAFIGFLLLTGSLFFVAKFVLEKDEFRYVRKMSLFFALPGALLFWGAGRLDPALSAVSKFLVSGALILVLILVTQALQQKKRRPLVALVLALTAAALTVPLLLLLLWLFSAWFPSTFFTLPPTEYQYESRPVDQHNRFALARTTENARRGISLAADA